MKKDVRESSHRGSSPAGPYDKVEHAREQIKVQSIVDPRKGPSPLKSPKLITSTHTAFCARLPTAILVDENTEVREQVAVMPGKLCEQHVRVERHIPPARSELEDDLKRFAEGDSEPHLSQLRNIIGVAAFHHEPTHAARQARTVLNELIVLAYLHSPNSRSTVKLGLPAEVVDRWFRLLYQPAARSQEV